MNKTTTHYRLLPLEKYPTTKENLLFWIKHFYISKFTTLKIDDSKVDDFDLAKLSHDMLDADSINKVSEIALKASRAIKGVVMYKNPLEEFYGYVLKQELQSIKQIDQHFVKQFCLVENSEASNSKKDTYYKVLKTLFNFIQEHNTIPNTKEPFMFNIGRDVHGNIEKIIHARKPQDLPSYLEISDMKKIDNSAMQYKGYKSDVERARDILIIRLFMFGLITVSELRAIKDTDFILLEDDKEIIELKLDDRVTQLYRPKFIQYINAYRKGKECEGSDFFFCGTTTKREISKNTILNIIDKHAQNAGIKIKVTPETLRNSGAIYLRHTRGIGELKIQDMMGHKKLQTTQRILKLGSKEHIEVANNYPDFKD